MSLQPVRFIQSGDWHLETPLHGVSEVPPELREPFIEAPYLAAERVVQTALDHRVDFLLLTGNVLPIEQACPYTFEFLLRQFQRLAEQNVDVYWLGADNDDVDLWPAPLDLPGNVHLFPVGRLHQFDHRRDGKVIGHVIGQGLGKERSWNAADFSGSGDGIPRIAAVSGKARKRSLENKGVDYWALGGECRHRILVQGPSTAVYAGSPQGRQPSDTDPHGAVLVELQLGQAKTQFIETDLWRWRRESVQAVDISSVDDLQTQLTKQLANIPTDATRFSWLVVWSVVCQGELALRLHQQETRHRLLKTLQQFTEKDARWTMEIETQPADVPSEWYEEDTVLGDFLRAVRTCEQDADAWQVLSTFLPDSDQRDELVSELKRASVDQRKRLWGRVAAWGADLLRGDIEIEEAASAP